MAKTITIISLTLVLLIAVAIFALPSATPQPIVIDSGYVAPVTTDPAELLAEDIRYMSMDHAIERHGSISITIRQACESDPALNRTRSIDGRRAKACEYEPGKWGVAIYEADGDFITAFRNKAKCLDEIKQYFRNRGYTG